MKFKKLKKIVATATVLATFFTTTASAATNTTAETTTTTIAKSMFSTSLSSEYNSLDQNVLKVNIDDDGAVNYSVPASTTGLEDKDFSWDNALVYFVLTDRFVNGDKSNDHSYGRSVGEKDADNYENRAGTFHGGDLKGLTSKINEGYFTDLGINAIWITAPYEQIHGALTSNGFKHYAYHGYYALDFSNMDANMGTEEDLETFIDTAHKYGIRVIFDVVMNHAGYPDPVTANEYGFGKTTSFWKDIYYNTSESEYKWTMDYNNCPDPEANQTKGTLEYDADWSTAYWGQDWIRLMGSRFKGYNGEQGNGLTLLSDGLPDFKTENESTVELPQLLQNKWKSEKTADGKSRYDKEMAELDAYFAKGHKKIVRQYIVKWLSDWVREYGVDGFRCDTAKHVELKVWKELKDECVSALKEWRTNNPNKPGAQWTDDFWMTGENFGWSVNSVQGDSYFTQGGFDSIINFDYDSQSGGKAFITGSNLVNLHQGYADKINSCDNNALTYISSHDRGLSRGNMINAGTSLVLCPGGVQVFYGDETNRKAFGPPGQDSRSQMNWNSIDNNVLEHWQKVGQFRNNHIAVGAGTQKTLNPTTYSRVWKKDGKEDKVVVSLPSNSGSVTVPVGDAFKNGEEVKDAYTGKTYRVSGGNVTVEADTNKVVLLESTGVVEPYVSVAPASKNYYDQAGVEVTLTCHESVTDAKYSIDGGAEKSFTSGTKVTVGAGKEDGEKTTVTVTGTANGKTLTDTATYTKIPKPKTLTVHIKDTTNAGPYNAYVYSKDETNKYAGAWPGAAMTAESNGWYVYETEATTTGLVIYNGSWGQYPGAKEPGIEATGEVWILDKVLYDHNPEQPNEEGKVIVKYVDTEGNEVASTKTMTGKVGDSYSTSAAKVEGYELESTPSNANGTYTKEDITVTYVYKEMSQALSVVGEVSVNSPQEAGTSIKLTAKAYCGEGTIKYAFEVTDGSGNTTTIKDYSTTNYATWKPTKAGVYTIKIKAKDSYIEVEDVIRNYNITKTVEDLEITSATSSVVSPQNVGTAIKLTTEVKGGEGTIKYRFVAVSSTDRSKTEIKSYSTSNTATWKPTKAGKYTIYFKVKDNSGTERQKTMKYEVKSADEITINSLTTSKLSPEIVGTAITLKASATSSNTLTYRFWAYTAGGEWKALTGFTSSTSFKWSPSEGGNYLLGVDVKDDKGNVVTEAINFVIRDKVVTIQENNSKITYKGSWTTHYGSKYSRGIKKCSNTEGDTLTFKFKGTGISIISAMAKNRGVAEVTIDGTVYSADMYSSTNKYQSQALKVTGLENKTHTITIKNVGISSKNSTGTMLDIDAFKIYNGKIV